jgi:broad specificity phosphatase PhoE
MRECSQREPAAWAALCDESGTEAVPGGGESYEAFQSRVVDSITRIAAQYPGALALGCALFSILLFRCQRDEVASRCLIVD